MRRQFTIVVPALLALALFGVYAPTASASSHESSMFVISGFTANAEHWIDILSNCSGGTIDYPANALFFVSSGWGFAPWTPALTTDKRGFMSESTTFTLLIDGQLQKQSRVYQYYKGPDPLFGIPDLMAKLFNTENDNGLTGSHLFTGQYYLDASLFGGEFGVPLLVGECNTTVNFIA